LRKEITTGLNFEKLPDAVVTRDGSVPHAPKRNPMLDAEETRLALKNSLRYFPNEWHEILAAEFLQELKVKEHHKLGLWAYLHVQIPALELPNEGISH
jgi:urocanate hydratase